MAMKPKRSFRKSRGFTANLHKIVQHQLERFGVINPENGVSERQVEQIRVKTGTVRGVEVTSISQNSLMQSKFATQKTMTAGAQAMQRAKQFAGSTQETAYSYGALTKNLAAKILRSGANIPPEALAAAETAAAGRGDVPENVLQDQLRGALGIEHSGASFVNGVTGQIRGAVKTAANYGVLISTAQRGGAAGMAAQGELISRAFEKVDEVAKSDFVQKIAVRVGEFLGKDSLAGLQWSYAASRVIQFSGAIGSVVMMGAKAAQSYLNNQITMAQAEGQSLDVTRQAFLATPVLGRQERLRAERTAAAAASSYDQFMALLGFGGAIADQQNKAVTQNAKNFEQAEKYAANLGVDVGGLLAQAAAQKGKSVSQLNSFERHAALQTAVAVKLQALRNSKAADIFARNRVLKNDELGTLDLLTLMATPEGYDSRARRRLNAKLQKHREEYGADQVKRIAENVAVIQEKIERYQTTLSKEQHLEIETKISDGQFRLAAYRQRHRVKWDD